MAQADKHKVKRQRLDRICEGETDSFSLFCVLCFCLSFLSFMHSTLWIWDTGSRFTCHRKLIIYIKGFLCLCVCVTASFKCVLISSTGLCCNHKKIKNKKIDSLHCYMEILWKASGIVCISVFMCVKREPWDQLRLQTSALKAVEERVGGRRGKSVCVCVWWRGGWVDDWMRLEFDLSRFAGEMK